MDKVIDETNINHFENNNINICLPRHVKYEQLKNDDYFYSYGLDEIIELIDKKSQLPKKILIDIAQGHMLKLWETAKLIKETFGDKIELMVGNIANPDTYRKYCEIGVDYIRVGIGGGSACTTSANVSIHYPMASLIEECAYFKSIYDKPTKIIADGGFKNYSDIIKALALGADYVMLGGVFNKTLESCGENFMKDSQEQYYQVDSIKALNAFDTGGTVYKYYRGMSTKEVQKSWNRAELKTGEGITKYNKVEYTLNGWCENFTDYLKSAMSYCGSRNLQSFIGEVQWKVISPNSFLRFHK
jgi:IMP dehydrogenase/GMP reductase